MWAFMLIEVIAVGVVTCFLYKSYGSFTKRPWYVTAAVLMGWFLSFSLIYLLPVDVGSTKHEDCLALNTTRTCDKPFIYVPLEARKILWKIIYWITYTATWLMYPIFQAYTTSGEFGVWRKFKAALHSNLIFYAIAGGLGVIALIYVVIAKGFTFENVMGLGIAMGNTWGMLLVSLLMGHGLVDLPRTLWRESNNTLVLRHYLFELAAYEQNLSEARAHLHKILRKVRYLDNKTTSRDLMRKYIDILLDICPNEYATERSEKEVDIIYAKLVSIHYKLKMAYHNSCMYQSLYDSAVNKAIQMEDIIYSKGKGHIEWSGRSPREGQFGSIVDKLEYFWRVYIMSKARILLFVVCALMSLCVIWSEVTMPAPIDMSIFSWGVSLPNLPSFWLQTFIFFPVFYIATCSYSALFQLKVFNFYRLIPHQNSDSNSLLFSAAYLSRLTAPMCYNFLLLIHYSNTAFVKVMGKANVLPVFGRGFNIWLGIVILIVALITLFNVYSSILGCLNIPRFQFAEDFNHQNIDQGQLILDGERSKRSFSSRAHSSSTKNLLRGSGDLASRRERIRRTRYSDGTYSFRDRGAHESAPSLQSSNSSSPHSTSESSSFNTLWGRLSNVFSASQLPAATDGPYDDLGASSSSSRALSYGTN